MPLPAPKKSTNNKWTRWLYDNRITEGAIDPDFDDTETGFDMWLENQDTLAKKIKENEGNLGS